MDAEELKREVRAGRIGVDRLVDLVVMLLDRVSELEKKLSEAESRKWSEPFSLQSEEKRRAARGKPKKKRPRPTRRGRVTTADKIKQAERAEKVFPADVSADACHYSHTRPVWRLEAGRAVLIAYEIYRGPKNRFGKIPGVLGRSEFGFEIVLAIGLSQGSIRQINVGRGRALGDHLPRIIGWSESFPRRRGHAQGTEETISYAYDNAGDMVSASEQTASGITATPLAPVSTYNYAYDNLGNPVSTVIGRFKSSHCGAKWAAGG